MKCLVTGGAGFIGSHLVDRLLKDGHDVVVIDDFSEGKEEYLRGHPRLRLYCASILEHIEMLFRDVEVVFHLAALPRPQWSIVEPKPAHDVNVTGTLNVLLASLHNDVERVVFTSSASVYGEQPTYPSYETCMPNPMSPYALHKLIGEQYCKLFTDVYDLSTICLRLFNVYGARMSAESEYSSLIPKFMKLMRADVNPTIYGDGEQARDFVYIDDVVEAFVLAAEKACTGVYNVGYGQNTTVNEVFRLLREMLGANMEAAHGPAVLEPTQTLAYVGSTRRALGWEPTINLRRGLGILTA